LGFLLSAPIAGITTNKQPTTTFIDNIKGAMGKQQSQLLLQLQVERQLPTQLHRLLVVQHALSQVQVDLVR
jgi:hypothetical protein